jgi:hypothetical protein
MSALQTVSMKKGRGHLPRISPKYDPGKPRHARYWSPAEDAIIREQFAIGGAAAVLLKLPSRTATGVYQRAKYLKVNAPGRERDKPRGHYVMTDELAARMREAWPGLTGRGDITRFAEQTLKLPKWWVLKQAVKLGLGATLQKKEPPWTAAENELMARVPLHSPEVAARIFREHGFNRTPTAIMVKAKRLNLSRRYKVTMSATAVAKILGCDTKTVGCWCAAGEIKAVRREESKRLPQQGGAPWSIERADLRQFVIDHIERIDIRKVDKLAFVDLLVKVA